MLILVPSLAWWGISLALELVLVAALALFCVITFAQIMPADQLRPRILPAGSQHQRRALAERVATARPDSWTNRAVARLVDVLAWCLPDLDRFTPRLGWSMAVAQAHSPSSALQSLIYSGLLVCAGLFDLYRKNL